MTMVIGLGGSGMHSCVEREGSRVEEEEGEGQGSVYSREFILVTFNL